MGVLADSGLLNKGSPFYRYEVTRSEGASWSFMWNQWVDGSGDSLDCTTLTATCKIITKPGGATILTLDTDFYEVDDLWRLKITASDEATAGLANGRSRRDYRWLCDISDGDDSFLLWGPIESFFHITSED